MFSEKKFDSWSEFSVSTWSTIAKPSKSSKRLQVFTNSNKRTGAVPATWANVPSISGKAGQNQGSRGRMLRKSGQWIIGSRMTLQYYMQQNAKNTWGPSHLLKFLLYSACLAAPPWSGLMNSPQRQESKTCTCERPQLREERSGCWEYKNLHW